MTRTPQAVRAFAASVVMVTAGGTVATAAVLHLPVLGFGAASAAVASPRVAEHSEPAHRAPIRVVRTRIVDDVVHRPAPISFARPTARPTARSYAPVVQVQPSAPTVANVVSTTTTSTVTMPPPSPTTSGHHQGDHGQEDGHSGDAGGHTTNNRHGADR